MIEIPKMPESYKGKINKSGGYTKTQPRAWTEEELKWVENMKKEGYTNKEISYSVDRSIDSVAIKIKRVLKDKNTYNKEHILEKYEFNNKFLNTIKPASVLDLYCGENHFYEDKVTNVTSNDNNKNINADYNKDALDCICHLYSEGCMYDMVDLDPFGSAYDCFDLAIKMAKKGIAITFGEIGHKRWKRLDFVSRYYGITKLEDFTINKLIEHVQMIGERNKKKLVPLFTKEWRNIGRVWFTIEPLKITEQWENSNNKK